MILDEVALGALIEQAVRKVVREELAGTAVRPEEYVSVAEAGRRVEVTPATIRDWIAQKRLGRYHAGRELRVRVSELEVLLRAGPAEGERSPEEEARRFLQERSGRRRAGR
ncbi:MAG TPA: helix-turn-helix domain-containing protein [Polyangia bacterium]